MQEQLIHKNHFRAEGDTMCPSASEILLRDRLIELLQDSGIEVIDDTEEGQRVLDMANGSARQMSLEEPYDYEKKVLDASEKRTKSIREQRVYHGTGNDFDVFDHSHMGEGEGALAHGWGTYVTKSEGVGRKYATTSNKATGLKRSELDSNINRAEQQLPYLHGDVKAEKEKEIKVWKDELSKLDDSKLLYTVEIPDDTGNNYIEEEQTLQVLNHPDMAGRIDKVMDDYLGAKDFWHSWQTPGWAMREEFIRMAMGQHPEMSRGDAERKYSELLSKAGVVGVHYNGRKDGDCYVIFDDKDLKITDKLKFFLTPNGDAYGYTLGGKIYIDPKIATAETPIHEYAHLWGEVLRKGNPEEWKNVVGLMKQETVIWDDVKKNYPHLESDDDIADEVLATYSGRQGAKKLRELRDSIVDSDDTVDNKRAALSSLERFKQLLSRLWKDIADLLHIHYTSAEEVADKVMIDLLNGVKPVVKEKAATQYQFIGEVGAASLDKSQEQTIRLDNLRIARQMEASNKDALSIKLASGWERGGDGLWRYEIDDSSYLAPSMTKDGTIYKLSDVLSGKGARELFAAYPEMRNFDVVYKQLDNNLSGWYNNGRIYLNNSLSQEESYVTILHEIQHAIQYNEGFSTGANVKDIRSRIANIIDNDRDNSEYAREQLRNWAYFRLARTRLNTYERLIQSSDTTSLSRAIDCYWEAMDAIDNDERSILVNEYSDIDSSDDIAKSGYHVKEAKEELDRLAKLTYDSIPEGNMNSLKLVDKLTNALKEYSDKELYSLVGGEVEARNVERRMNMSLEERHRTLAAETEDVARKDQLFLQDENVVSAINDTDEIIGLQVEKLFNDALNGSFTGKPVSIGKLSHEGKTYLEHLSGLKMKEHVDFVLNPSDLKHIYNDHFGSNEKDSGNNIPLTSIDLRNVYKVLSHPDGVIYGVDKKDGRKLFFFLKKMPTGLYNLAEICSTKKGNLTAKSYYITKKGINQRVMEIKSSLLPTSVTYSGESLSTAKVPQLFESSVKKDEKLSDNTKIRFQFIGEHGAKNLDIADGKSSRIDNLRVAKNMDNAGRDALAIKVATGWEKGADGKWRYEIMDPQYIDLSPTVQLSNLIKAKNELPANTRKSLSRYENMSAMTKKQSDNYAALVSKSGLDKLGYYDEEMLREGHGNARLCELLTPRYSSSLFKAYPVLRDVHVNYMPMPLGELGSWNPQTKEIGLTSTSGIMSESIRNSLLRKSLLHEIQHAIQYMEGFCAGSSPEYYEAQLHETSEYQAMMKCKKNWRVSTSGFIRMTAMRLYICDTKKMRTVFLSLIRMSFEMQPFV